MIESNLQKLMLSLISMKSSGSSRLVATSASKLVNSDPNCETISSPTDCDMQISSEDDQGNHCGSAVVRLSSESVVRVWIDFMSMLIMLRSE